MSHRTAAERVFYGRVAKRRGAPIAPPTEAETSRGILSTLASIPFDLAVDALNVLDYVSASTRALVALPFGIEGSGRDTIFGVAPSGRELIGLGTGEKGTFEAADVPGFVVEAALDPTNLISFGTLSTAGKAAKATGELADMARVAGVLGKTKAAEEAVAKLARQGLTAETAPRSARRLVDQVAAGQRRGLTLDIPWGPKFEMHPFGGRVSGRVFAATDRAGAAAARAIEPIAKHFRAGGRIGTAALQHADLDTLNAALSEKLGGAADAVGLFNEAVQQGIESKAGAHWEALRLGDTVATNLARAAEKDPLEAVTALRDIHQKTQVVRDRITKRFDDKIAEALERQDMARVRGLEIAKRRQLREAFIPTAEDPLGATKILTLLGVEKGGAVGQIETEIARLTVDHANAAIRRLDDAKALRGKFKGLDTAEALERAETVNRAQATKLASRIDTLTDQADAYRLIREHLPEPIMREVDRIKAALGTNYAAEQAAGVKYKALGDVLLGYMPRRMTREAIAWASKLPEDDPLKIVAKQFQTTGSFAFERVPELRGVSIPAINDLARAKGFVGEFFTENAAEAVTRRLLEGGTAQGGAHVAVGALTLFALPKAKAGEAAVPIEKLINRLRINRVGETLLDELPKTAGGKKLAPVERIATALKGTAFENAYIPRDIATALLRVDKTIMDPKELRTLVRWIERANGWYRYSVTQLFPAFHARNKLSNMFMMGMAGMRDVRYLWKAAQLQRRVRNRFLKETGRALREGAKVATDVEMDTLREAIEYASVGGGYHSETRKILDATRREIAPIVARGPLGQAKRAIGEVLGKVGTAIEDHDKIALYLWARDKGQTAQEAGRLVKKWLFDYGDLSHIEKKPFGLRSQAYFWTYTRKSVPLLFAELVMNPRKFRLYGLATGAVGSRREQQELLPSWLAVRNPIYLGGDEEGRARFAMMGLPPESLTDFATEGQGPLRALQKIAAQMAPLPFRHPFELLANVNLRTGRPGLRSSKLLEAGLDKLPAAVRREAAGFEKLEPLLPSARYSESLTRLLDAAGAGIGGRPDSPARDAAASLLAGVTPIRIGRTEARTRQTLNRVEDALEQLERMGSGDGARAKQLRTLRGRLRRTLRHA